MQAFEAGFDMLWFFPKVKALGRPALQALCDDWARTPVAEALGVVGMTVGTEEQGLKLVPRFDPNRLNRYGDLEARFCRGVMEHLVRHGLGPQDHPVYLGLIQRLPQPLDPELFPSLAEASQKLDRMRARPAGRG